MLSTIRSSWLLYSLLALVTFSSALRVEDALHIDGIEAYLHHGIKRQASGTTSVSPTDDDPEPTPTPTPTRPTSTPTRPPTSTPSQTPDETSTPTTRPSTTRPSNTPTTPTEDPTTTSSRITSPITRTTPFTSTSVTQFTTVIQTVSNGQSIDITSVTSSTSLWTGMSETTELPSPQDGGSGGSSGLSDDNKKIIGGVVGGVGGAILLGGIAMVCWRIWGRKRRVTEDDDDLMAGTGSALGEKPQNSASPFQSNLEQYHNPGGRPNAAANF